MLRFGLVKGVLYGTDAVVGLFACDSRRVAMRHAQLAIDRVAHYVGGGVHGHAGMADKHGHQDGETDMSTTKYHVCFDRIAVNRSDRR